MNIAHCIYCGGTLEKKSDTEYVCTVCQKLFYHNNAPAVSVLLEKNGLFLFARRAVEPMKGKLDWVGGFMERGEEPKDTAIREVKEETGLEIGSLQIMGAWTSPYHKHYATSILYLAADWSGDPTPSDDVSELVWAPLDITLSEDFAWPNPKVYEEIRQNLAR